MINTAFLVVAALAFAAALVKAASMLRLRREPGQGLLLTLLLTLAVTCFALSDKVQYQEDRLYHDLGRLLSNVTTMIAAFAILALLMTLSLPLPEARPKVRRRLLALAVCVTGMAVSFTAASPLPETLGDFGDLYDTRPELLVYITLFIAFLGTALAELLVLAWRYARLARRRPYLRGGLMLMCAGSVLGLVYLAEKTVYVITQAAHWPPPFASDQSCSSLLAPPQCAFSITLPITAVLLAALGATLPVWGPALTAPFRYYRNRRFFHALEPLWQRLRDEFPQITLPEQDKRASRPDLALRLYRRVIEIDDGRLLLRPYLSPAITIAAGEAAAAHGLRGQDLRATIEAAEIAAALRARQADFPIPAESPPERTDSRTSDVSREAAWLARVARAYATSPVVQDLPALR
jgi:uncharacterized protein DUF6545